MMDDPLSPEKLSPFYKYPAYKCDYKAVANAVRLENAPSCRIVFNRILPPEQLSEKRKERLLYFVFGSGIAPWGL
jgi:hypothetical protein